MLASRWLRASHGEGRTLLDRFGRKWEAGYGRVKDNYRRLLGWSLRHRWPVVGVCVALFAATVVTIPLNIIGTEFLPPEDQSQFDLIVKMPPGTALEATNKAVLEIESRLSKIPEVVDYFTNVGMSSAGIMSAADSRSAVITVKTLPKRERSRPISDLAKQAEGLGEGIPGVDLRAQLPSIGGPLGQPLLIQLQGNDLRTLEQAGARVEQIVRNIPGTTDVENSAQTGNPEVLVRADHFRLADLGLTSALVASALRTNVEGTVVSQLRPEGQPEVDIRIMGSDKDRAQVATLGGLPIPSPNGIVARMDQAVNISLAEGSTEIRRLNRQRVVTISANVSGRPLGDIVRDFKLELQKSPLPEGVSYTMTGETEMMDETFANLVMALLLSILFMYMLMVALYESLLYPLVVMFSLPMSVIGAIGGLLIMHQTLNLSSLIGMVMLMGLVGKNGILLVDYTNTLRARGKDRTSAITEAGPTRLRPILMTAMTMVLALLPVAFQAGEGSEIRSPMAIAVVGGLLSSLVLTLILVPVVYTLFDDLQQRLGPRKATFRTGATAVDVDA
jgi:HAE1 family hydrophobic/amphiphilic exporter-1